MNRGWALLDTVGVGDPELGQEQILGNIRNLIKHTSKGVHSVVVVMKMGRASNASRANAHVLNHLFRDADILSQGVLVLTHWEGELGNEDNDLEEWLKGDEEMTAYCRSFAKVILTNNQLQGRGAYPECREKCLEQLRQHVETQTDKIKAKPVTFWDVVKSLLERFGDKLWGGALSMKSFVLGCGSADVPTYCGDCSVCLQPMELAHACKLACNHTFHGKCVDSQEFCPLCRASAATVWQFCF